MAPDDQGRVNRLTIYMIKPKFRAIEDIVEETSVRLPFDGIGQFVYEDSHPRPPAWITNFFGDRFAVNLPLITSSAKAIYLVSIDKGKTRTQFAISFGSGRHLLKPGVTEGRFGLKVVLNSVAQDSFRIIDKTTLGSIPKHSREQMSRNVAPGEFGIDIEQDLVSAVTAKSSEPKLGKVLTGKDALSISVPITRDNIREFLSLCLSRYRSTAYKKDFDWIDQIAEVRDAVLEDQLNLKLVDKINQRQLENVWMAVPDIVDWASISGFRHVRAKRARLCEDLTLEEFLEEFPNGSLTLEKLKAGLIFALGTEKDEPVAKWSAFECTYAEIDHQRRKYILNNAKWYNIAQGFAEEIEQDFSRMAESDLDLPDYQGGTELEYNNRAVAQLGNARCMDQDTIIHGGGHNRIEFCDILTADRRLVHVKKYGGSSVLSHLFSQGAVSGELFVSDRGFREKLNLKLPRGQKLPGQGANRPNASDYEIVYAIISDSPNPLNIPFFSKVSLRTARRRLSSFGFQVTKKKIQSTV
jgi:uncharacterized protein (TIGR04141 family)